MSNVLNEFKQPASGSQDNPLILGGTVETAGGQNIKKQFLNVRLTDVSTASSCYVVSPVAGNITKIYSVINGTIATANSVITSSINGAAITGGSLTIAFSGSAAGDIDSATPTAANTVAAGDLITLTTDGASSNTVNAEFTIEITLS